jgi:hypothetical protein
MLAIVRPKHDKICRNQESTSSQGALVEANFEDFYLLLSAGDRRIMQADNHN